MRRALVVALAALAAPPSAHAGTVTYESGTALLYTAAAGETNRLTISIEANRVVYREQSIAITEAEADCDGNGTTKVTCKIDHVAGSPVSAAGATLGDKDDKATTSFPPDPAMRSSLTGGDGDDDLDAATATSPSLDGGNGSDTLTAGHGRSMLTGGSDADTEFGGPALSSTVFAMGPAADGADQVNGGAGFDTVSYADRAAAVTVGADGVADDGEPGEGDAVSPAVEGIEGGDGSDVLTASPSVDAALSGLEGDDRLIGGAGDDILLGGAGDDALVGNDGDDLAPAGGSDADAGADSYDGGDGFDTIDYSLRGAGVSVTLNGQPDDGEAGEGDNVGGDVEHVIGTPAADTLTGGEGEQWFTSLGGDDTLDPGDGEDRVAAGSGDDTVSARDDAADRIACGVGTDGVQADAADTLTACENADVGPAQPGEDHTAPRITIRSLKTKPTFKQLARGLRFRVSGDEPASFVAELFGTAKRATIARAYNLSLARKALPLGSGLRLVSLRPSRALLGKRHKLKLRLRLTATDASGNSRTRTRTISVRRLAAGRKTAAIKGGHARSRQLVNTFTPYDG